METYDLPVGTGNRGARSDWNALPDRATGQRKMIMRLDVGCISMNAAAGRRAFIGNDGTVRQIVRDNLPGRQRIQRAVRNVGLPGDPDMQRLFGRLYGIRESLQRDRAIFVGMREIQNL